MPVKRATTEKEYFKNASTWKQISTNVPPKMLEKLKSRVTEDLTMSHLLREIIAESSLMRYGVLPQPSWCLEMTQQFAALKEEIIFERQLRTDVENALLELKVEIAELRKEVRLPAEMVMTYRQKRQLEQARIVALLQEERADDSGTDLQPDLSDNRPVKEKPAYWPIIGRLTAMLGVARKTA